jgi:hypothetical protein
MQSLPSNPATVCQCRCALAWLTLAVTKIAVFEYQAGVADSGKALGEGGQAHMAGPAKTVGHHDRGEGAGTQGAIEVRAASQTAGGELDLLRSQKISGLLVYGNISSGDRGRRHSQWRAVSRGEVSLIRHLLK